MRPPKFIEVSCQNRIAVVTISRGKVNAINDELVKELSAAVKVLRKDKQIDGVMLSGRGKFFSFGFDVPELFNYTPRKIAAFVKKFSALCRELFLFPKPLIAAVNGHATAGGCILALTAEQRIMTNTNAKVSLHEVSFCASLFPAAVEMLRHTVGNANAESALLSGKMFEPAEALKSGLVNELVDESKLMETALLRIYKLSENFSPAYSSLKKLLRQPSVDRWTKGESKAINNWVKIWYSPQTRAKVKEIKIY